MKSGLSSCKGLEVDLTSLSTQGTDRTPEGMAENFRYYAETEFAGYAPLYAELSRQVAEDPELLRIAAFTQIGQYPPNMLFAAVHYLLLRGEDHPLSAYYATLIAAPLTSDKAFPLFRDFCLDNEPAIKSLLETRLVQTNEVGRSPCLLPAFGEVSRRAGGAPLALIDVGAAAGLNLLFDRYFIDYGRLQWGDPASPVRLRCELRGDNNPPLQSGQPVIGYRAGVDLNPIDLTDPDEVLWLRALVWPELRERSYTLPAALALAKQDPPGIVPGDAVDLLPSLIEEVPEDLTLCLYHSFALGYFPPEQRERFRQLIAETASQRPLYFVEMSGSTLQAYVRLSWWTKGEMQTVQLAECAAHGQWLRWLGE